MKYTPLLLLILLLCKVGGAQNITPAVFNSTGGSAVIGGDVYDWSIGEMMISTYSNATMIVECGLLHPDDPNVGMPETAASFELFRVYPNPAREVLHIESSTTEEGFLSCQLYDFTGKLVRSERLLLTGPSFEHIIPMEAFPAGEYVLKLFYFPDSGANPAQQTFKIHKVV